MAIDLDLRARPSSGLGRRRDGWTTERAIGGGIYLAVAAVVVLLVTQSRDLGLLDLRLGPLDSDTRASILGVATLLAMAAAALAVGIRAALPSPARCRWLMLGARTYPLLLAFAFIVHLVGLKIVNMLGYRGHSWPAEIKAILKHGGELAGSSLIAAGVVAGCQSERNSHSTYRWR